MKKVYENPMTQAERNKRYYENKKIKQVKFDFNPEELKRLDELQQKMGEKSRKQTILKAVEIALKIVD